MFFCGKVLHLELPHLHKEFHARFYLGRSLAVEITQITGWYGKNELCYALQQFLTVTRLPVPLIK